MPFDPPRPESPEETAARHEAEQVSALAWQARQPAREANLRSGGRPDVRPGDVWAQHTEGADVLVAVEVIKARPHRFWLVRDLLTLVRREVDERRLIRRLHRP